MKGKFITVAIIILIFGYFVSESIKDDAVNEDPMGFVLSGNDTLGRDWGAIAAERERVANATAVSSTMPDYASTNNILKNADNYNGTLLQKDPYLTEKLNQDDYTSIQAGDGREIITGYEREEEREPMYRFQTRHQKETGNRDLDEPQMKFKE